MAKNYSELEMIQKLLKSDDPRTRRLAEYELSIYGTDVSPEQKLIGHLKAIFACERPCCAVATSRAKRGED